MKAWRQGIGCCPASLCPGACHLCASCSVGAYSVPATAMRDVHVPPAGMPALLPLKKFYNTGHSLALLPPPLPPPPLAGDIVPTTTPELVVAMLFDFFSVFWWSAIVVLIFQVWGGGGGGCW